MNFCFRRPNCVVKLIGKLLSVIALASIARSTLLVGSRVHCWLARGFLVNYLGWLRFVFISQRSNREILSMLPLFIPM